MLILPDYRICSWGFWGAVPNSMIGFACVLESDHFAEPFIWDDSSCFVS